MFKFLKSNPVHAPSGAATGAQTNKSPAPVVNPKQAGATTKTAATTAAKAPAKAVKPKAAPKVYVLKPAPAIAAANPLAKPTRANMFYISAMAPHGGVGHRKDRWFMYYPGLSLFDCQLLKDFDHTQLAYYAAHGLVTLTAYTDAQVAAIKAAVADGTYKPNQRPAGFKTKWGPNAPAHLAVKGQ